MSTFGEVFTGAALLLSAFSRVYSASIHWMSVEEEGITSISIVTSQGTPARRHNSVINTENEREVGRLRMEEKGLILEWHIGATDESKPISCSYTQVPLLDRDSCLNPPRGGVRDEES
ncbi:hypothetical protein H5410_003671 [Solanum commersonii]|uniref:Secreted protein n=1 Tax=Solanum commersonii TaxID=4109 RepID=A0A9J6B5R7_SOLCO|nr:hypothetical protein H5410_003671 [Solanum commersonii]